MKIVRSTLAVLTVALIAACGNPAAPDAPAEMGLANSGQTLAPNYGLANSGQ